MKKMLLSVIVALLCCNYMHAQDNYAEILQKSMFFYEAQMAGDLPETHRVNWRGPSALSDGSDAGLDLTKGMYDAGDHVKFNFPMAFTTTVLAWTGIEYKNEYIETQQLPYLLNNIKWNTDYFMACHPEPRVLYGQVGEGQADHSIWAPAEIAWKITPRTIYYLNEDRPGTELVGETSAAMAAASILFKSSDKAYANELLTHAEQLFDWAYNYPRGKYVQYIPASNFYNSWSGYQDEIVWSAIWMYLATDDKTYLNIAEKEYDKLNTEMGVSLRSYKWTLAWDDKAYACYLLMAKITGKQKYYDDMNRYMDYWTSGYKGERVTYTPAGLPHLDNWGALRYAANTAYLAKIYSEFVPDAQRAKRYADFAQNVSDYILGDNPEKMSYVVGYKSKYPLNVHHRTAWGWADGFHFEGKNCRHIIYGALVGGPNRSDKYTDKVDQYQYSEVACDYNAAFSGLMAAMYGEHGGSIIADFPVPETPGLEFFLEADAKVSSNSISISSMVNNWSAWPAVYTENLRVRYYLDLTDVKAAGYGPEDFTISSSGYAANELKLWDVAEDVYYAEVGVDVPVYPANENKMKESLNFSITLTATGDIWDPKKDWSYQGINSATAEYFGFYENGEYLGGIIPNMDLNEPPIAIVTADNIIGKAPLEASFDGSKSYDPNGLALTYNWTIDGTAVSSEASFTRVFTTPKTHTVCLAVTDDKHTTTKCLTVEVYDKYIAPKIESLSEPANGDKYYVEDPVVVTASASDFDGTVERIDVMVNDVVETSIAGSSGSVSLTGLALGFNDITVVAVDNEDLASDPVTVTVEITEMPLICPYGLPLSSSLPSTGYRSFNNIMVLGDDIDLSNVTNMTINWDAPNNGLWQFSLQTNDGNPSWWNDIRNKMTYSFNTPQPQFTIENSGFPGFEGTYYVRMLGDDFIAHKSDGSQTLIFNNTGVIPECTKSAASELSFQISSNPFTKHFTVNTSNFTEVQKLEVYTTSGQLVETIQANELGGALQLGESYETGMYVVVVHTENDIYTKKVLKK